MASPLRKHFTSLNGDEYWVNYWTRSKAVYIYDNESKVGSFFGEASYVKSDALIAIAEWIKAVDAGEAEGDEE